MRGPDAVTTGCYPRLLAVCEALRAELVVGDGPVGPGWISAATLPEHLEQLVAGECVRIRQAYGCEARPHVAASRLLHHLLWSFGLLVSGPWYLERQLPRLSPEQLWIEPVTGDLAVRVGEFAPGGPAELRAGVAGLVEPLLEVFQPLLRRGRHALWGMATDDLVSGVWYLGRMLGEEERAVALAGAVLPGDTPPFPGAADFRRLAGREGLSHVTRTRLSCCLFYAIRPAETCLTCPRTTDAERVRRLEA